MNWTGGRLKRHSKANENATLRAQKQHFARARLQKSNSRIASPVFQPEFVSLPHIYGRSWQFLIQQAKRNPTSRERNLSLVGPGPGIYSSDPPVKKNRSNTGFVRKQSRVACKKSDGSLHKQDRKHDQHLSSAPTTQKAQDTKLKRPGDERNSQLARIKKTLLRRADWVGLAATKPVHMKFASAYDLETFGRRRHKTSSKARRQGASCKRLHEFPAAAANFRPARFCPDSKNSQVEAPSIRMGTNIHQTQTTQVSDSNRNDTLSNERRESSVPMLLDKEITAHQHGHRRKDSAFSTPRSRPRGLEESLTNKTKSSISLSLMRDSASFDEVKGRSESLRKARAERHHGQTPQRVRRRAANRNGRSERHVPKDNATEKSSLDKLELLSSRGGCSTKQPTQVEHSSRQSCETPKSQVLEPCHSPDCLNLAPRNNVHGLRNTSKQRCKSATPEDLSLSNSLYPEPSRSRGLKPAQFTLELQARQGIYVTPQTSKDYTDACSEIDAQTPNKNSLVTCPASSVSERANNSKFSYKGEGQNRLEHLATDPQQHNGAVTTTSPNPSGTGYGSELIGLQSTFCSDTKETQDRSGLKADPRKEPVRLSRTAQTHNSLLGPSLNLLHGVNKESVASRTAGAVLGETSTGSVSQTLADVSSTAIPDLTPSPAKSGKADARYLDSYYSRHFPPRHRRLAGAPLLENTAQPKASKGLVPRLQHPRTADYTPQGISQAIPEHNARSTVWKAPIHQSSPESTIKSCEHSQLSLQVDNAPYEKASEIGPESSVATQSSLIRYPAPDVRCRPSLRHDRRLGHSPQRETGHRGKQNFRAPLLGAGKPCTGSLFPLDYTPRKYSSLKRCHDCYAFDRPASPHTESRYRLASVWAPRVGRSMDARLDTASSKPPQSKTLCSAHRMERMAETPTIEWTDQQSTRRPVYQDTCPHNIFAQFSDDAFSGVPSSPFTAPCIDSTIRCQANRVNHYQCMPAFRHPQSVADPGPIPFMPMPFSTPRTPATQNSIIEAAHHDKTTTPFSTPQRLQRPVLGDFKVPSRPLVDQWS